MKLEVLLALWVLAASNIAAAQEQSAEELAKKAQNPIASMISVPVQSNINFDWGPEEGTFAVTNIQPVLPFKLNDDWNVVTRTILPIVTQPRISPEQGRKTGTGDTLFTAFFVPADSGAWTWGVGPAIQLPTTSNSRLGADEWGVGASFVALTMPGRWVLGGLVSNVWGISEDPGNDVNVFTFQPFVNYNFDKGWYFTFAPIISANWEASSGQKWTVPLGAGFGKIFKIGSQSMNAQVHYYYNVEKPDVVGDSSIRLQLQWLFPR
jgi:hypothetical protein